MHCTLIATNLSGVIILIDINPQYNEHSLLNLYTGL